MENWAEVPRLARAEGLSIKAIVRWTGISPTAVRPALTSQGPPKYARPARASLFDEVQPELSELLAVDPRMPATVIAGADQLGPSGAAVVDAGPRRSAAVPASGGAD